MSKIIQIAAGGGQSQELFALDSDGRMFVYSNQGIDGRWTWGEIDPPSPPARIRSAIDYVARLEQISKPKRKTKQ